MNTCENVWRGREFLLHAEAVEGRQGSPWLHSLVNVVDGRVQSFSLNKRSHAPFEISVLLPEHVQEFELGMIER